MRGLQEWNAKHGAALRAKQEAERRNPKGPKGLKRKKSPPNHDAWQRLSVAANGVGNPTKTRLTSGDQIEVEIARVELHQKSQEHQAVAYWEPVCIDETVTRAGRPINRTQGDRFKIVLKAHDFERWPVAGERWLIIVNNVVKTIAFATPLKFLGESEALRKRRAKEAAEALAAVQRFCQRPMDGLVRLSIKLPDPPHNDWEELEVWNRVDHYSGDVFSCRLTEDGSVSLVLDRVWHRRSQSDIEGGFEGNDSSLEGRQTFRLHAAAVENQGWHDSESGINGRSEALAGTGVNTNEHRSWTLWVN